MAVGALVLGLLFACSAAEDEDADSSEGAATPSGSRDAFEQIQTCDNILKDRAAFRGPDLEEGVLRWKCGDVDGVTISKCEDERYRILRTAEEKGFTPELEQQLGAVVQRCRDGYGQEYCEYHAVSKGTIYNGVEASKDLRDGDVVQCVFTSVFKGALDDEKAKEKTIGEALTKQLIETEDVDDRLLDMAEIANSRGAADMLLDACWKLGRSSENLWELSAQRQTRCYRAWSNASTQAERTRLESACKRTDLTKDASWSKTGLDESRELDENDKDLVACSMVLGTESGVRWRNSDPTICGRVFRARRECGVTFNPMGRAAPTYEGFTMQGWTNREVLPVGCRYLELDGAAYNRSVICTPAAQDVRNYRAQQKPLQMLCRDKFALNVALEAPIGTLANLAEAKEDTPFCRAFVSGARAAQSRANGR